MLVVKQHVSTAGGDIQVGKVSGSATMKTAGGDIILNGASGVVMAKTAGGDLHLKNVTGSVQGETAGGDVACANSDRSGSGSSRLATAGGDVTLFIPENAKATIEARIRIRGTLERFERRLLQCLPILNLLHM